MRVKDLSGREHPWLIDQAPTLLDDCRPRSEHHLRCRHLLRSLFPFDPVLEEVPVPGEHLYLDFFIPKRKLVVEVHGQQHYEAIPFFHKDNDGFNKSVKRDKKKDAWAKLNSFKIVVLPHWESNPEWIDRIKAI